MNVHESKLNLNVPYANITRRSKIGWGLNMCAEEVNGILVVLQPDFPCYAGTVKTLKEKIDHDQYLGQNQVISTAWFVKINKEWKRINTLALAHPVDLLEKLDDKYIYSSVNVLLE